MRFEKSAGTVRQFVAAASFVLLAASLGACGGNDKKPASGTAGSTGVAGATSGAAGQGASGSTGAAGENIGRGRPEHDRRGRRDRGLDGSSRRGLG